MPPHNDHSVSRIVGQASHTNLKNDRAIMISFHWSTPVGGMDYIPDFLEFRRERLGELFDKQRPSSRPPEWRGNR